MKKVLITGANRGIGFALTKAFLAHGDFVIATQRTVTPNPELQALKAQYPNQLDGVRLEVTAEPQYPQVVRAVESITADLDILINNAGILRPSESISEVNGTDLRESFAVNTIAPILLSQAFLPLLQKSDQPKIVNITMPSAHLVNVQRTANHHYIASRYALNALTKMMSVELGQQGITTIALYPGYIKTDMNNHAEQAAVAEEAIPQLVPLIHGLTAEDNGTCLLPSGERYDW